MEDNPFTDRYHFDVELGRGGMGMVYRAHDTVLDRPVAVKVLTDPSLGEDGRAHLLREAQAAAQLNHPNIVAVYDAGEAENRAYIVMELVEGETLHEVRPDKIEEVVRTAREICAALEHAHSHGIVHRDLKPENVLIAPDGGVKLMDFGLARPVASRVTVEGTIAGTVFYLAPEQAMGQPIDCRADLYALGVMLYELTTGRLPFTADDPLGVISQHLHAAAVPPSTHRRGLSPVLEGIILKLLEKDPSDRFTSAGEVSAALDGSTADTSARDHEAEQPIPDRGQLTSGAMLLDRMARGRIMGRESEVRELREMWNRAANGQGHMVLISGEPGIGKTRLAEELAVYAGLRGGLVLRGHFQTEMAVPYLGFWEALRNYLRSLPHDVALTAVGPFAPELVKLVPEVLEIVGRVEPNPPMGEVEAERLRLFDHVTQFLLGLASQSPILFLLDDLHWADSPSLLFLHFLLRNTRQAQILLVGTYRETELDSSRPLYETLVGLNRERLYTRIILRRLPPEVVGTLLGSLLNGPVDDGLAQAIARETDGNPFFIEEVVRALLEKDALRITDGVYEPVEGQHIEVPQSIQVAIGKRLARLSESCRSAMTHAAVLGEKFEFDVLRLMGEWEEDPLLDALDEAERAQLVVELKGEGHSRYRFAHMLLVQVLYDGLNSRRQARFHQRAGEALERVYADRLDDQIESLAYHYSLARTDAAEKAVSYSLRAAEKAVKIYAHDQAIGHYHLALEALEDLADPVREAHVWELLGDTHLTTFATQKAMQAYTTGLAPLERAGLKEDREFCRISHKLGQVMAREGEDPKKARGYLEHALAYMPPDVERVERVKCLAALASCLAQEDEMQEAIAQAETALELAESTGHAEGVASACGALCHVHQAQGDLAAYMEAAERQVEALDEIRDLYGLFEAYWNITKADMYLGRYREADQWALAALEVSKNLHAPGWESLILAPYTLILNWQGRWPEALAYGERVLPLFQRVGCSSCFCYILAALAEIEAKRGQADRARGHIKNAIDIWLQLDSADSDLVKIRWRFFGHVFLQEWDDAWAQVEESRRRGYPQIGSLGSLFHWTKMIPEVAARTGRWSEATSLASEALALSQSLGLQAVLATARFAIGLAQAGQERWGDALHEYGGALAQFREVGHAWDVANTQYEMGLVHSARRKEGDLEAAEGRFQEALAAFEDLGAEPAARRTRLALETIG